MTADEIERLYEEIVRTHGVVLVDGSKLLARASWDDGSLDRHYQHHPRFMSPEFVRLVFAIATSPASNDVPAYIYRRNVNAARSSRRAGSVLRWDKSSSTIVISNPDGSTRTGIKKETPDAAKRYFQRQIVKDWRLHLESQTA